MCATMSSTINGVMLSSPAWAEVWVVIVLVAVPTALVCGTVIILVLTVERKQRVQAIKALPPLVSALARQIGSLGGKTLSRQGKRAAPSDEN